MKKQEYLDSLNNALVKLKIRDINDIVMEYAEHFEFKIADGFTEEEIAAKLGDPAYVAQQFAVGLTTVKYKGANAPLIFTSLVPVNIGVGIFFSMFAAWIAVLGGFSLVLLATGGALIFDINIAGLIPHIPYFNSLLFGITVLFLAVLSAVGTVYSSLSMKQLFKAYIRWHRNITAAACGKPVLPSVSKFPRLKPKFKRIMRGTLLVSLIGFGIALVVSYVAATISAGAFEWWHTWQWFM